MSESGAFIPTYNASDPELWTSLVEMAFDAYEVKEENKKVFLTIAALPVAMQSSARDYLVNNESKDFAHLKEFIIKTTAIPDQVRMKKLLSDTPIGDRKPSEYLRYLRELSGRNLERDSPLLKSIFMEKIPSEISVVLELFVDEDFDRIASMADRMQARLQLPGTSTIAALNAGQDIKNVRSKIEFDSEQISSSINSLKLEATSNQESLKSAVTSIHQQLQMLSANFNTSISSLQQQITALSAQVHKGLKRNYRERSDSARHRTGENDSQTCYFHRKFGNRAHKCIAPCSWLNTSAQQGN